MEWFKEKKTGILLHYINIMFLFVVIDVCYEIENFNYLYVTLLYLGLMVIYWVYNGLIHRKWQRIIVFLLATLCALILAYFYKDKIAEFINVDIIANIDDINNQLLNAEATYFYQFKPVITVILPVVVFILFFFYYNNMTEGVLLLTLAVMIFFWYLEYFDEIKILIIPFIIIAIVTYMVNNYKKVLLELQKKGIYSSIDGTRVIINVIVFTLIAGIVVLPLPQDIKGKDELSIFQILENEYGEAHNRGSEAAKSGIFGLQYTGYNNTENRLGGPIRLDNQVAFRVVSDKALYLKGDVRDEYTGYSWKKTTDELTELQKGINPSIDEARNNDIGNVIYPENKLKEIKIFPEKLRSSSFMVPIYTNRIKDYEGEIFINEENSTFVTGSYISKPYTIEYYDVEYKIEMLDYYTVYYGYNDKYSRYLQLPEGITTRTVELVYDLVKDCNNNQEKVEKLKDYLSNNYSYTLDASVLPEGRDFVDYFLFEDPKGYCVYFATALTVMYRIAGIPARYVEGYKMSETSKTGNVYAVTNDTAHAWVEYLVSDDLWAISDCSPTALENNIIIEQEKKQEENTTNPLTNVNPDRPNNAEEIEEADDDKEESAEDKGVDIVYNRNLLYVELTALAVLIMSSYFVVTARKRKKMLKSESVIPLYNYINKRLKRYNITKRIDETEKEFAAHSEMELKDILKPLTKKVYEEYYGGIKDHRIDKRKIYYDFEKYLRKKDGILTYYLKRLF
ncbi:transglutaminase-like domain-containing protein [Clostridium thermarum]|uniref:transglutaminase-like domain-containing protein n=1 Tax=Clostridium thermarum TaxID=1716543 RepID=UPI0013D3257F|nr:transglutaminase-like domain-containing protein [Clostridium thermarum]